MDYKRAQEIMESHGVIEVLYQEQAVWIEQINHNDTAIVSQMTTGRQQEVSLSELTEGHAELITD